MGQSFELFNPEDFLKRLQFILHSLQFHSRITDTEEVRRLGKWIFLFNAWLCSPLVEGSDFFFFVIVITVNWNTTTSNLALGTEQVQFNIIKT